MKVEKEESAEPALEEDNIEGDMNDYDNDYDEKNDQDFENKTVQKTSKNNDSSTEKQTPSKWKWAMITDETIGKKNYLFRISPPDGACLKVS